MEKLNQLQSRKKFIGLGMIIAASITAFRLFIPDKKERTEGPKKVKMLTQEGTLVEVDAALLPAGKSKKISEAELKQWVSKK